MDSLTGGCAPSPPKRPTIIKQNPVKNEGSNKIPVRPAPPVPKAPSNTPKNTDNGSREEISNVDPPMGRPLPPRPGERPVPPRPTDKLLPPRPSGGVPLNTQIPAGSGRPLPPAPSAKPSQENPVKRRPEITIVSARPMSEVGFRGDKPVEKSQTNQDLIDGETPAERPSIKNPIDVNSNNVKVPLNPAPRVVSRPLSLVQGVHVDEQNKTNMSVVVKCPSPSPRSRTPRTGSNIISKESNETSPGECLQQECLIPTQVGGGSVRKPPSISQKPQNLPAKSHELSSAPDSSLLACGGSCNIDSALSSAGSENIGSSSKTDDVNANLPSGSVYAVINKPKRPTIIRPEKTKQDCGSVAQQKSESEQQTPPELQARTSLPQNNDANKSGQDEVPEFLKKKLRSTVDTTPSPSESSTLQPSPIKPKPSPLPKPKPSAVKPAVSTKPTTNSKPTNQASEKAERSVDMISDVESAISSTNALQETQNKMTENTSSVTMNFKRPTIIRPQRGFKTAESDENVKSNELSAEVPVKYVDKSSTDVEIRPRPATRPVSMMSVSYSKKDETEPTREANDLSTSPTGSADFLVPGHPSPLPRPTPRGRPKSVMLPQAARPPPPAARAQDDSSTGQSSQKHIEPSKPVSRPPPPKPSPPRVTKSQPEPDAPSERAELSATDRRSSLKRIGVSVFPPAVLQAASASKVKDQVKVYSDSSDEEFFMAPEKPERPSAGPRVSPAGPVQEASVEPSSPTQPANQVTKPPRSVVPGPNPDMPVGPTTHARKTSEQENEEVTEKRGKPPRPGGGPTRPTSVPVKSSAPPKPSPPKPAADGPTKKSVPTLPSRPGPGHPLYHHMMQTPHGVAMHDYTAQADDELPFKTGDLLLLVRRIDADWLVGRLGDREGMFPQAFIKVKMPLAGEALEGDSQSEDSVEMSACASTEKPDNLGSGPRCRARFDFDGEGPDDLVFEDGDVIRLLERVGLEWRRGEMNGRQGLFPLAFVEIIEDLPANDNTNSTSKTVRAVFDFDGELGELSFQAGDAIQVTHIVNEEWLYGEMGPCRGQFPVQFVDHVPPGLPPLEVSNHGNQTCGLETAATSGDGLSKMNEATRQEEAQVSIQCVAVYDFPAQSPDDLPFSVGDHIEIVERIGADWARGRIGGRQGMFPVSFVEILHQTGSQQENDVQGQEATEESDMETGRRATALYDFTGEADNELTFLEGDIILVEGPMQGAEDWCWGVRRGNRGIFPAAFVEMVS